MRRVLLFMLPILIIIGIVFAGFGMLQVRFQQERLMDDLERKAKNVAESMELSALNVFEKSDLRSAQLLVDKFQKRERLQGCIIYSKEGKILAVTERIADWGQKDNSYIDSVARSQKARGRMEKYKEYSMYSYVLPVLDSAENTVGLIEVVYDTSYIFNILTRQWRGISVALIVLVFLMIIVPLPLQRQIFVLPVQRLTEWFTRFQKGETDEQLSFEEIGDLGKLAKEVEQVALGLRVARRTVSREAQDRVESGDLWTEKRLQDLVRAKLGESSLFLVSNREPYMHVLDEKTGKT